MDTIEDTNDLKIEVDEDDGVKEPTLQFKMSNFLGKLTRTLGWGPIPTKVYHVGWNDYVYKHFSYVEGMFVVVPLPEVIEDGDMKLAFEVVMHSEISNTNYAYSVLRTTTKEDGIHVIKEYINLLPCFVESCGKEFFNQSTLQKVLDVLRDQSTWLPAHIAAYFGFIDSFKNNCVLKSLNECEVKNGFSALHVAVENELEKVISPLLSAGASLEVFDKLGNSPIHLAASKNISVIQALKPQGHRCLNLKNSFGETPLLIASKASKLDNVKALIQLGANLNHEEGVPPHFDSPAYQEKLKVLELTKDISHKDLTKGGNLLHWCKTKETTSVALELGCLPNLLNRQAQTPLHVMVLRGRMACLICLVSKGADPNVINLEGDNPLHLAAGIHNIFMVQALICFGANVNAINILGETPRHIAASTKVEDRTRLGDKEKVVYLLHAVGAGRCKRTLASCSEGCSLRGSFNGVPLYEKPLLRSRWVHDDLLARTQISEAIKYQTLFRSNLRGRGRVLCLDGGGIKGLVLCQMLDVIKDLLGRPITDCFDWIVGTSTGGFLALELATGKSVVHAQSLYYSMKDRIFAGTRPYDTRDLEALLKDEFGEATVMSAIRRNRVSVTTTLADRLPADLHMFRNYEAPIDVLGIGESSDYVRPLPPSKQKVWMAARASGAAPTYFSSTDKYLDGGLIANNPVLDTLTEIEEWNMAVRAAGREDEVFTPTVVVSLGCGKPPVTKVDNVDLTVPSILDMRRGFQAMFNMFNLLVEQACASEGRVVDRARSWCASLHVPFFRFNPQMSDDCGIDEHEDAKLLRAMWEARSYMETQSSHLLQLKNFLLQSSSEVDSAALEPPLPPPRRSVSAPSTPVKQGRNLSSIALSISEETVPEEVLCRDFALRESRSESRLGDVASSRLGDVASSRDERGASVDPAAVSSPDESFYSTDSEFEQRLSQKNTEERSKVLKAVHKGADSAESSECREESDFKDCLSSSSVLFPSDEKRDSLMASSICSDELTICGLVSRPHLEVTSSFASSPSPEANLNANADSLSTPRKDV